MLQVKSVKPRKTQSVRSRTCGTIISPLTSIRSSTLTLAHSRRLSFLPFDALLHAPLPPTPNSAPTFRHRSRNNQTGSPFFTLTEPAGILVPSKKIKGMRISVFLTASCIARNSLRRASRVCASDSSAAFVSALGGGGAFGFGAILRDDGAEASSTGVFEADRETPEPDSCGVALESSPTSSFSSSANESLLFANGFFFFFFGGPSDSDALFLN